MHYTTTTTTNTRTGSTGRQGRVSFALISRKKHRLFFPIVGIPTTK